MYAQRCVDAENTGPVIPGALKARNGNKVTVYPAKDKQFWSDLSEAAAKVTPLHLVRNPF